MENRTRFYRLRLGAALCGAVLAGSMLAAPAAGAASDDPGRPQPPPRPPRPVGAVQICKAALTPGVTGAFEFRIRGGVPSLVSVDTGRCSAPIPAIVNEVAVTELPRRGTAVRRITATPPERLLDVYLPGGQVIVRAGPNADPTVVTFGNVATRTG